SGFRDGVSGQSCVGSNTIRDPATRSISNVLGRSSRGWNATSGCTRSASGGGSYFSEALPLMRRHEFRQRVPIRRRLRVEWDRRSRMNGAASSPLFSALPERTDRPSAGDVMIEAIADAVALKLQRMAGMSQRLMDIDEAAKYLGMTTHA